MPETGTNYSFLSETISTQDGQAFVSGKNTIHTGKNKKTKKMGLTEKYRVFKNVISREWAYLIPQGPHPL